MKSTQINQNNDDILQFRIISSNSSQILDRIVKSVKINNCPIKNYEQYIEMLDLILLKKNQPLSEIDFLFQREIEKTKESIQNPTEIQKMSKTGKIGNKQTIIDIHSGINKYKISYNFRKIESLFSFLSIRANNCVFRGKWCYEVQLITNGLMQIGWCQLNTLFTEKEGVGDDSTSYAYDGWRKVTWHGKYNEYGNLWDVGDIIGVCIDLENRIIEYFLNGEKLGVAFKDLEIGQNIAYFPGISLSKGEKCYFNFGQLPFHYQYPGYEPLDVPQGKIDGTYEITKNLIYNVLTENNFLDILVNEQLDKYEKMCLSFKIFKFLSTKSIRDLYSLNEIIIPFLVELIKNKKTKEFYYFVEELILHAGEKERQKRLVNYIFDTFTNMLEGLSFMGDKGIKRWGKLIEIISLFFKNDMIMNLWFLNTAEEQIEHLKNIFNSNCFRYCNYYDFLISKYPNLSTSSLTVFNVLNELRKDSYHHSQEINMSKYENIYSEKLSKILYFILTDKRQFSQKKNIKDILNDLLKNGYGVGEINNVLGAFGFSSGKSRDESFFYKNVFFNLLYMFNKKFLNVSFDTLTTDPWFNRTKVDSIYYDEVGIGGTISHVTTEYINDINPGLITKSNLFYPDFFHKLIKLSFDLLVTSVFKKLDKEKIKMKKTNISSYLNFIHGATKLEETFRKYFYLFSLHTQKILYNFSFFLVKYLLWLKNQDPKILYFIPILVIELPFSIFKVLAKLNSQVLFNSDVRAELNQSSIHFKNDDYIQSIIQLYIFLFSDKSIANPELREKLLTKVNFFIKKNNWFSFVDLKESIYVNLLVGLMNDIKVPSLSHYACTILLTIVAPLCVGYEDRTNNKEMVLYIKKYYENNLSKLDDFINTFFRLLNQRMTSFIIFLSELTEKLSYPPELFAKERKIIAFQTLSNTYNEMCNLLLLLEFLLDASPDIFIDLSNVNSMQFINVLKNISTRLLEEPFLENLMKVITAMNGPDLQEGLSVKKRINILALRYSVIGIFIKMNNSKNSNFYSSFIRKIANLNDFLVKPFYKMENIATPLIKKEKVKNQLLFNNILKEIESQKEEKKIENKVSEEIEEENICILCYTNIADVEMIPCKHRTCEECMNIYRLEKENCFICHAKIESVEKLDVEMK